MTPTVLDASALMAYLQREPGYDTVIDLLLEAVNEGANLLLTSVNAGEVLYQTLKHKGREALGRVAGIMAHLAIEIVDVTLPLAGEAALLRAAKGMSYPNCLAAALAKLRGARLVTADPEFKAVEPEIPVVWLRPSPLEGSTP
ncbi:MAG TPA: type II toxin-antitoxin system VapC family toxin [Planctomycetota bacterium]|nr:type II toxin-antitoxin system VapC family toxin [Planctomycetota bacterium]